MKKIVLSVLGATALLSTAAVAAPMNPAAIQSAEGSNIDQVRLVCDEYGRCYRVRDPRYIQRSYGDDGYYVRSAMATTAAAVDTTGAARVTVIMTAARALGSVSAAVAGNRNRKRLAAPRSGFS